MKWMPVCWITLVAAASAAPGSLSELQRQVEEQGRQIRQLEEENERLRYMLTEAEFDSGDPLYGTKVSGRPGGNTTSAPEMGEVHIVEEGDTLSAIAAVRRVKLESLVELNRLSDPSTIRPGQRLRLPEKAADEKPSAVAEAKPGNVRRHTVRAGENFYRISLRYGVELEQLLAANPSVDPHNLRVGQQVRITRSEPMLAGGN